MPARLSPRRAGTNDDGRPAPSWTQDGRRARGSLPREVDQRAQASVSTLVTLGSIGTPGPNVVETVAFEM